MEIVFWVMLSLAGITLYAIGCVMGDDDAKH
jgi:hypothetical protein